MYPNLLLRFKDMSDEACEHVVEGTTPSGSDTRDKAFRILLDRITPTHLRAGGERARANDARKVLPTLTKRAAEGILQANERGVLGDDAFVTNPQLPHLWPHIVQIAEAD